MPNFLHSLEQGVSTTDDFAPQAAFGRVLETSRLEHLEEGGCY